MDDRLHAQKRLFGLGIPGVIAALRRAVPTQSEYPDDCAREYATIAINNLKMTAGMRSGWPSFIEQGLRLLVLERIFKARGLSISFEMQRWLEAAKASPEITATIDRLC